MKRIMWLVASVLVVFALLQSGCATTGGNGGVIPGLNGGDPLQAQLKKMTPEQKEQLVKLAAKAVESYRPGGGQIVEKAMPVLLALIEKNGTIGAIPGLLTELDVQALIEQYQNGQELSVPSAPKTLITAEPSVEANGWATTVTFTVPFRVVPGTATWTVK